jgi:hypothetical protein
MTIFFLGFMSVLALLFGAIIVYGTIFVHRDEGCSYFLAFLTVVLPMMERTHERQKTLKGDTACDWTLSASNTINPSSIYYLGDD